MFIIGSLANLLVLIILLVNNEQLKLPSGMYGPGKPLMAKTSKHLALTIIAYFGYEILI